MPHYTRISKTAIAISKAINKANDLPDGTGKPALLHYLEMAQNSLNLYQTMQESESQKIYITEGEKPVVPDAEKQSAIYAAFGIWEEKTDNEQQNPIS